MMQLQRPVKAEMRFWPQWQPCDECQKFSICFYETKPGGREYAYLCEDCAEDNDEACYDLQEAEAQAQAQ